MNFEHFHGHQIKHTGYHVPELKACVQPWLVHTYSQKCYLCLILQNALCASSGEIAFFPPFLNECYMHVLCGSGFTWF